MLTPVGDFSVVVVLGWFVRGWVLVAGAVLVGVMTEMLAGKVDGVMGAASGDGSLLVCSAVAAVATVVLTVVATRRW